MWFRTSKEQPKATQGAAREGTAAPFYPEQTARTTPAQAAEGVADAAQQAVSRAPGFFRRHPFLSIAGAAAFGLMGGIEMALGIALGAGVASVVRPKSSQEKQGLGNGQGAWRERAHEMWDHGPDELRKRARAVVEAARGHTAAPQA